MYFDLGKRFVAKSSFFSFKGRNLAQRVRINRIFWVEFIPNPLDIYELDIRSFLPQIIVPLEIVREAVRESRVNFVRSLADVQQLSSSKASNPDRNLK